MANVFKRRLTASDIPGYAGGTLQDELDQQPQVLTATNRDAITRPRETRMPPAPTEDPDRMPFPGSPQYDQAMSRAVPVRSNEIQQPVDTVAPPDATRQRAVSFDPQTGKPNDAFYRNNADPVEGATGAYNAYQQWQPHGAKRGFKNSLKAGAMYAADAVRAHPEDPVTAAIAGFATGAGGATATPNFKNRLTREWKLNSTGKDLQNQLGLAKEKAQVDVLQSKPQQTINAEGDRAMQRYNSIEHYDPDDPSDAGVKAYFESRGLHGLPAKDKYHRPTVTRTGDGQVLITDQEGTRNMTVGGQVVTDASRKLNAEGLNPGQQSVNNRDAANRKSREAIAERNDRTKRSEGRLSRIAAGERALVMVGGRVAAMGDPDLFESQAKEAEQDAKDATTQADELAAGTPNPETGVLEHFRSDAAKIAGFRREAARSKEIARRAAIEGSKIRGARGSKGTGGTVNTDLMPKQGKYAGRTISQQNLKKYAADHRISIGEAKKVFEGADIVP